MAFHVTIAAIRVTFWISSRAYWWSPFSTQECLVRLKLNCPYEEKDFGEVYWQGTYMREAAASLLGYIQMLFRDSRRDIKNMGSQHFSEENPDQEEELQIINSRAYRKYCSQYCTGSFSGSFSIAEKLFDEQRIQLNQSTVWRILKRRGARYTTEYRRWRKDPQYYCFQNPRRRVTT